MLQVLQQTIVSCFSFYYIKYLCVMVQWCAWQTVNAEVVILVSTQAEVCLEFAFPPVHPHPSHM